MAGKFWNETLNPVTGCTPVSEGCENCYAKAVTKRFPVTHGADDFGTIVIHRDRMTIPNWRKPRIVFVGNMGDIFHKLIPLWIPESIIDQACRQRNAHHRFIFCTKRAVWMAEFEREWNAHIDQPELPSNVLMCVTGENQAWLDERMGYLDLANGTRRGVLLEPLLGPINLARWLPHLDWVVVGAETGASARPCNMEWIIDIVGQCRDAGVPVWVKAGWPQYHLADPTPRDLPKGW